MTPEEMNEWYKEMYEWHKKRANDMMNSIPQDKTYKPEPKVMQDTQDKTAVLVGYIMVALVSGGLGVLFGMVL